MWKSECYTCILKQKSTLGFIVQWESKIEKCYMNQRQASSLHFSDNYILSSDDILYFIFA